MNSRLTEGTVVQSSRFVNGILEDGILSVGDYIENSIPFSKGRRENDGERENRHYVIVSCWEAAADAARGLFYQNRFVAKELNPDGTYNEDGETISFSTAGVFRGSIREEDLNVIKMMKKTFL